MNVTFVSRPAEPEEPTSKAYASGDDWWQSPLRDWNAVVGFELLQITSLGQNDIQPGSQHANDHSKVWKAAHTSIEPVDLLEDYGICGQEKVE